MNATPDNDASVHLIAVQCSHYHTLAELLSIQRTLRSSDSGAAARRDLWPTECSSTDLKGVQQLEEHGHDLAEGLWHFRAVGDLPVVPLEASGVIVFCT